MKTNVIDQRNERELQQFAQKLYSLLKTVEVVVGKKYTVRTNLLAAIPTEFQYYWGNFTFVYRKNNARKFFQSYKGWLTVYGVMKDNNISPEELIPVIEEIRTTMKKAAADARW